MEKYTKIRPNGQILGEADGRRLRAGGGGRTGGGQRRAGKSRTSTTTCI